MRRGRGAAWLGAVLLAGAAARAADETAILERARAAERDGDDKAALESYDAVLTLKGEDADIRHRRALILLRGKRTAEARAEAERAVRLAPREGRYLLTQGVIELAGEKPDRKRARSLIGKAVKLMTKARDHEGLADGRYHLGALAQSAGRLEEAAAEFRAALGHDPAHERARTALAALDPEAAAEH